jgi:hypothetical protein
MKKTDIFLILFFIALFIPFFLSKELFSFYENFNKEHGMITSFIKFAVLATMGEMIGLRIKSGVYNYKGFGILPRAFIWGFIGLTIKMAFVIFSSGVPILLEFLGVKNAVASMNGDFTYIKLLSAFSISTALNLTFAPVMMTFHKITDTHVINNNGTFAVLFKPIKFSEIITNMNWTVQWNFVIKKTIPFFWIPAHTITFILPVEYQVLFAALLGIALGIILAIASQKSKSKIIYKYI